MKTILNWIQASLTALGAWFGWFLGGYDGFLYALVAFVLIDYLTGVMCGVLDKTLSSEIGARGILKKVLIFALVGVGCILDSQVLGKTGVVRMAVIFFYLSNEGISILENAAHIGLPIPQKLKDVLEQLHSKGEIDDESK